MKIAKAAQFSLNEQVPFCVSRRRESLHRSEPNPDLSCADLAQLWQGSFHLQCGSALSCWPDAGQVSSSGTSCQLPESNALCQANDQAPRTKGVSYHRCTPVTQVRYPKGWLVFPPRFKAVPVWFLQPFHREAQWVQAWHPSWPMKQMYFIPRGKLL